MTWRGLWILLVSAAITWAADSDESTLAYLKNHPEDLPRQVLLKEAIPFKLLVDGKEAGTMQVPALATVTFVAIADDKAIEVSNGVSTNKILPAQTDLWERVAAIRAERASRPDPARDDPAVKLDLPTNSEPAAWYQQKIDNEIGAWLSKYPNHRLASAMKDKQARFAAEAARVTAGDVRRGQKWFTAAEAAPHQFEFAIEDLKIHLHEAVQNNDGVQLQSLLADVEKYARNPIHPQLLRAAHDTVQTFLKNTSDDNLRRTLGDWSKKWPLEKAAAEEKTLEQLKQAATLDATAAVSLLEQIDKAWPGNEALIQTAASLQSTLFYQIESDIAANRIAPAVQTLGLLEKTLSLKLPSSPHLDALKKKVQDFRPALSQARETLTAYEQKEFERVLAANFDRTPPALQKWYAGLRASITKRREDSSHALSDAEHEFIHLRFSAARENFEKAQSLWPDNPEIAARARQLTVAKWIGIFLGAILVLSLLGYAHSIWDAYRFKRELKRKSEESRQVPREF